MEHFNSKKKNISNKINLVCPSDNDICNIWAIGKEKVIFVDCGTDKYFQKIEEKLKEEKIPFPSYILITHCHFDHALAAYLFEEKGSRIVSHKYTKNVLEKDIYKIWPENPSAVRKTYVEISFQEDTPLILCDLEITFLHTPGHTPGSSSYLIKIDGKKYLFTGDLFFFDGNVGWKGSDGFNKEDLKESLEKIKKIDFDFILPGHGKIMDKERAKKIIGRAIKNTENPL